MAIVTRTELEAALSELCTHVRDRREGILGPRSMAWRVGGDLGVFIGGGRASLLQLAHPQVAYAIDHHSRTRTDIVGRFQRTFENVFAMVFGDLDAALFAARRVHAIHSRVHGEVDGVRYHANDTEALRWVHATLVDTTLVARARIDGAPLPTPIADRYVVEMNRFARLFAIPHELLPRSAAEHAAYMRRMLASDVLRVTPSAREMGQFLFGRMPDRPQPPLGRLAEAVSAELLPPHLAEAFALRASPRFVRASLATFRTIYRYLPNGMRTPAHAQALSRFTGAPPSRVTAWTEKQFFALARSVSG